ncbi:hypothetical protein BDQ17DRAFT_1387772 [Cyathus striatus]|nr:hypothetical protein BDQ17DRAFT_1387772 [Cyathus striatus]
MPSESSISVKTEYVPSSNPSLPALTIQVTKLVDSYMVWVGVAEGGPEGMQMSVLRGNLCKDWACAMPAKTAEVPATSLFRTSSSDVALSMARRLAKRFQKQIFLSVDLPVTFLTMGEGDQLVLVAEKGIVQALKGAEE